MDGGLSMGFTSQNLNDNAKLSCTNYAVVFVSSLYKTEDDSPYENYNGTYSLYKASQHLYNLLTKTTALCQNIWHHHSSIGY